MRKKVLKKYIGKRVSELPEPLRTQLKSGFNARVPEEAVITTWRNLMKVSSVTDGIEERECFLWDLNENAVEVKVISADILVYKLNIIEYFQVNYERSKKDPYLAIIDWGDKPILVVDANTPLFGVGHIVVHRPVFSNVNVNIISSPMDYKKAIRKAREEDKKILEENEKEWKRQREAAWYNWQSLM